MADPSDRGRAFAAGRPGVVSRPLGDEVAAFLAGTGRPLSAREIARGVGARHEDVLRVLRENERFYGPMPIYGRSPKARGYFVAPEAAEQCSWAEYDPPGGGTVYFIEADCPGRPIKVGRTTNPEARFQALQTASPVLLVLLGSVPEVRHHEADLHWRWRNLRRNGEWFSAEIKSEVLALLEGDGAERSRPIERVTA